MRKTLVQDLSEFAAVCYADGVPQEVSSSITARVKDIVGLCLAALHLDTSRAVANFVEEQGGRAQASAIGLESKIPASWAAFNNGVLAHSLDYDDTHLPSILHPSASVVPAALAVAQLNGRTGAELVRAIAAGVEICVRLGMGGYDPQSGNSTFFERGQHATSICGAIGGAASAALLVSGDAATVAHAMAIAVSMASGVLEANREGGTVKRLHCGWAAHSAVAAAALASRGITGPATILEGRFGLFQAFLGGKVDPAIIVSGLGTSWEVPGIFFKPYPANHFTHTSIDAAIALRERGLKPEDVESIRVGVAAPTVRTIGEPIETKRRPETGYQAQFSAPYAVAAGLHGGGGLGLGLVDFTDELARDPARRKLMEKISVEAEEEFASIYPHQFPARLIVRTTSGDQLTEEVLRNRGGPDNPLSEEELSLKFRDNAALALGLDQVADLEEALKRIESLESIDELMTAARIHGRGKGER